MKAESEEFESEEGEELAIEEEEQANKGEEEANKGEEKIQEGRARQPHTIITDEMRATVIDHVPVHGMTMAEAGL